MAGTNQCPPCIRDELFRRAAAAKKAGDEEAAFWWGKIIAFVMETKPRQKRKRGIRVRLARTGDAAVLDAETINNLTSNQDRI